MDRRFISVKCAIRYSNVTKYQVLSWASHAFFASIRLSLHKLARDRLTLRNGSIMAYSGATAFRLDSFLSRLDQHNATKNPIQSVFVWSTIFFLMDAAINDYVSFKGFITCYHHMLRNIHDGLLEKWWEGLDIFGFHEFFSCPSLTQEFFFSRLTPLHELFFSLLREK